MAPASNLTEWQGDVISVLIAGNLCSDHGHYGPLKGRMGEYLAQSNSPLGVHTQELLAEDAGDGHHGPSTVCLLAFSEPPEPA